MNQTDARGMSQVMVEQRRWNVPGTLGFVLSALGVFGCWVPFFNLIAIPGLVLSFVGLFRPGRVLATLGVLLGLIGSLLAIVISLISLFVIILGQTFGGLSQFAHVAAINGTLEDYRHRAGMYPAQLSLLPIDSEWRVDRWGNQFEYEPAADGQTYRLRSTGPDGRLGTSDDIEYSHMFSGKSHRSRHWNVGPSHNVQQEPCEAIEMECESESLKKQPV